MCVRGTSAAERRGRGRRMVMVMVMVSRKWRLSERGNSMVVTTVGIALALERGIDRPVVGAAYVTGCFAGAF